MADRPSEGPRPGSEEGAESSSSSISDAEWEKFVQDSERDAGAAAPKEPSARARMVTERLRQQDARGESPPGWRTGPAWQEMNGRAARRRRLWAVLGVPLAVAVAVVAVKPSLIPGDPLGTGGAEAAAAAASPLPAETAAPSTAPAGTVGTPTRSRPFAGSPAARWAAGPDAIEVPEARAVGGVSAARIETALRLTKEFLVASNLDRDVLRGAQPKKALALIDPLQKGYLSQMRAELRRPTADGDPKWTFTRFDPKEVELAGGEVRLRGRMTVEPGEGAGKALIRADYTFVYPLARAGGGDEVARTIVRRVVEVDVSDPVKYQGTEGRIWVFNVNSEIANDDCARSDGLIHPMFLADLYDSPEPSGAARDPYDRSKGLDEATAETECGIVTRT
ncbi:hypothetical protein [Streptomyces sp. bgisy027]|uniref:hypothetical protein n=1 Tax=unclassified Streptomyces TaxID=2593676 RepID=UPI003D729D9C